MQNIKMGVAIAIIAAAALAGGFWFYQQRSPQEITREQLPIVESNNDAGDNGEVENDSLGRQPSQIKTDLNPGMDGSGIAPGDQSKGCPAVAVPASDFCPGGEILAKAAEGCVVGYECKKISGGEEPATLLPADISCADDDDCIDPGCGECVNEEREASNSSCVSVADERKICKCVAKKCVAKATCGDGKCDSAYETKINCSQDCGLAAANSSCATKADCVDDGTTCHVCVNAAWLKQNPEWSTKYACKGIGVAVCECRSGDCKATE